MTTPLLDTARHPIDDDAFAAGCAAALASDGALVLEQFFTDEAIRRIVHEVGPWETSAFYASSTHNVSLTPIDPLLPGDHPLNRQVASSKGLIADDQIPIESPLREVYDDPAFRSFLCRVLGIDQIYAYADDVSSINVHYAGSGMELGWHFDNSSFAVTALLQAPDAGGVFEYVPAVRDAQGEIMAERVGRVLDGREPPRTLDMRPGDLVLFRGRESLHRVTPTEGSTTRILVVFAFNSEPGIALSDSARATFYGRPSTVSRHRPGC